MKLRKKKILTLLQNFHIPSDGEITLHFLANFKNSATKAAKQSIQALRNAQTHYQYLKANFKFIKSKPFYKFFKIMLKNH